MPIRTAADGARLFHEHHAGPAPAFVLVHGLTCDHTDWRLQVAHLRTRHEVVAVDQRGHGRSERAVGPRAMERLGRDLADLLVDLGIERAILVGHSMGCRVVLQAAALEPARVVGLVLADGSRMAAAGDAAAPDTVERTARGQGVANLLRGMFDQMFVDGVDRAMRDPIVERAVATPEATAIDLLRGMLEFDALRVDAVLARVEAPVLAVQSTYVNTDRVRVPIAEGESTPWLDQVRAAVPGASVEIIPGVGHFNMLDAPERFNDCLDRFAARVTG